MSQRGEIESLLEASAQNSALTLIESANVSELQGGSNVERKLPFVHAFDTRMIEEDCQFARFLHKQMLRHCQSEKMDRGMAVWQRVCHLFYRAARNVNIRKRLILQVEKDTPWHDDFERVDLLVNEHERLDFAWRVCGS